MVSASLLALLLAFCWLTVRLVADRPVLPWRKTATRGSVASRGQQKLLTVPEPTIDDIKSCGSDCTKLWKALENEVRRREAAEAAMKAALQKDEGPNLRVRIAYLEHVLTEIADGVPNHRSLASEAVWSRR